MFAIDVTVCRRCGGSLRVLAAITDADEIARILHDARPPPRQSHVDQRPYPQLAPHRLALPAPPVPDPVVPHAPLPASNRSSGVGPRDRFCRLQVQTNPGQPETITFETSQDPRAWRPVARTLARVPAARPMITIGSHEPRATTDAAVVRAMTCSVLQPVAEIPYERDLSRPRNTDAPATGG